MKGTMNMKTKLLAVAAVLALGIQSYAETNVSHSITSTVDSTLSAQATREKTAERPDWSTYPTVNSRAGVIQRNYDWVLDGIDTDSAFTNFVQASNTLIDTKGRIGFRVPSNTIISAYVLDIVQASSVATQRFALGLNAAGDLLGLTTNFGVVHRRAAIIDPAIKATNDNFIILSTDGGAATSLEFNVWFPNAIYAP